MQNADKADGETSDDEEQGQKQLPASTPIANREVIPYVRLHDTTVHKTLCTG